MIKINRYQVNKVLREINQNPESYKAYKEDAAAFLAKKNLSPEEREAIAKVDFVSLYAAGAHPFILNAFVNRVWEGDRQKLDTEFRSKIAPYGYPDFST